MKPRKSSTHGQKRRASESESCARDPDLTSESIRQLTWAGSPGAGRLRASSTSTPTPYAIMKGARKAEPSVGCALFVTSLLSLRSMTQICT